jgi:hypothetical protein
MKVNIFLRRVLSHMRLCITLVTMLLNIAVDSREQSSNIKFLSEKHLTLELVAFPHGGH